jgi:hypothetical protein
MAFSNAFFVRMSRGRRPDSSRRTTACPARSQSSRLASLMAACAELFGRLNPSASIAVAMVFAVYMPPHDPGPGHACCSRSANALSDRRPAACWPTASKTETMSTGLPDQMPGMMVPP